MERLDLNIPEDHVDTLAEVGFISSGIDTDAEIDFQPSDPAELLLTAAEEPGVLTENNQVKKTEEETAESFSLRSLMLGDIDRSIGF